MILHTFLSNTLISKANGKLALKQAKKIKQMLCNTHPEAGLLLFKNYSCSSSILSFKNNRTCSKN